MKRERVISFYDRLLKELESVVEQIDTKESRVLRCDLNYIIGMVQGAREVASWEKD